MQTSRLLQAVTLLLVIVVAASCTASKEYSSKLFGPRPVPAKDSQAVALRFLELDKLESTDQGWVDTKIIRDSVWRETSGTAAAVAKQNTEDNLPKTTPAIKTEKPSEPIIETEPIAKSTNTDGTRNKTSREK
jgi:hypothetical protein